MSSIGGGAVSAALFCPASTELRLGGLRAGGGSGRCVAGWSRNGCLLIAESNADLPIRIVSKSGLFFVLWRLFGESAKSGHYLTDVVGKGDTAKFNLWFVD